MYGVGDRLRSRGLFALVALLFVLGEILGLVHLTSERHEVCREHGELIHVGHADGQHVATGPTDDRDDPAPEHEEDQHCRVCASMASPTLVEPAVAVVPIAPTGPTSSPTPVHEPLRAVERYALAPKTSPPRA